MYYAATYAYGRRMVNHGNRADHLWAFERRADADATGDERLTRAEAIGLFGRRAVEAVRKVGYLATHVCDGRCR